MRRNLASVAILGGLLLACASPAGAAPPQIASILVAEGSVTPTTAVLKGSVNPGGAPTTYAFEFISEAAYVANLEAEPPRESFAGASQAPTGGSGLVGAGTTLVPVTQELRGLVPSTSYRYRLRVTHTAEPAVFSITRPFATQVASNVFELLDRRSWEMVSPIEKDGDEIQPPGTISGGGVFQAAAAGGAFVFSSADSFGPGAPGAPSGSQYVATRAGSGWLTANITAPLLSGSYGSEPDGVPYQLFSGELGFGLLSNGERCRGVAGGECPVANPPLPGSGAPAGYRDYYRHTASGAFESILTATDLTHTELGPEQFEMRLVGATPDLSHVVVSSCAALTANATEVASSGGCDAADQNLYEWSGGPLSLVNGLPGEVTGSLTPAAIGASSQAISDDGSRVYFASEGEVYLSEGGTTRSVLGTPGGMFEAASADGSTAYLIDAGELERYSTSTGTVTQLTTGGGVEGVLGISADGSRVYYAQSGAIYLGSGGTVTEVASSATASNWPAATGTARVTSDGSRLLFLSDAELTGYPNEGETEAFLYGPAPGGDVSLLTCVSCNPSGERPQGSAAIPGARANGSGPDATDIYKPRVLSADGNRVFFESADTMVPQDTNRQVDVYEWEAGGEGTCARFAGCLQLISGGRDSHPSYFVDADQDGGEAFFLTGASLFSRDPGSYDIYDAREGGGFAVAESAVPCTGDACQVLPEAPEDPSPGTLTANPGNPLLKIAGPKAAKKKKHKRHKARHAKKSKRRANHRHGGKKG